jgi:hypothetical protein
MAFCLLTFFRMQSDNPFVRSRFPLGPALGMKGKRDMALRSTTSEHTANSADNFRNQVNQVLERVFHPKAVPSDRAIALVVAVLARYIDPQIAQSDEDREILLAVSLALARLRRARRVCGRCLQPVKPIVAESCWVCSTSLCGDCWEKYGHCGHPGR